VLRDHNRPIVIDELSTVWKRAQQARTRFFKVWIGRAFAWTLREIPRDVSDTSVGTAISLATKEFSMNPSEPMPMRTSHRILLVFLPFACGYYLSYLYRSINALISEQLTAELRIDAEQLGLLTAMYFLTFSLAQLPFGVLLDRYGPRKVQCVLLLIAAFGSALFGAADSFSLLLVGRALIGLGAAAGLMAGLKAIVMWFPKERVALVNGWYIMLGALGALSATMPAELLLSRTGWRGLFAALAVMTAVAALLIYLAVPEPTSGSAARGRKAVCLKAIYADRRFWRLAPLSTMCIATAWALQGLWAAPWLTDVEGLNHSEVVQHLFIMASALSVGALTLGIGTDWLRRRGVPPQALLGAVAAIFMVTQIGLILRAPAPSYAFWAIIAAVGSVTVLSYAILAESFPREIAAQANAALNVLHIGGAFVLQYAIGVVVERWASLNGHYPAIAYSTAFSLGLVFQVLSLAWFLYADRRLR
jgi:MFS family permease